MGVPGPVVEEIHSEYPKLRDRLRQVILAFLRQEKPRPTWSAIIDALNSQAVNLRRLAHDVEAAHPMSTRLISGETAANLCTPWCDIYLNKQY